jgi:hypothetical protein
MIIEPAASITSMTDISAGLRVDYHRPMSGVEWSIAMTERTTISTLLSALRRSRIKLSEIVGIHSRKVCLHVSKRSSTRPVGPCRFFSTETLISLSRLFATRSS